MLNPLGLCVFSHFFPLFFLNKAYRSIESVDRSVELPGVRRVRRSGFAQSARPRDSWGGPALPALPALSQAEKTK